MLIVSVKFSVATFICIATLIWNLQNVSIISLLGQSSVWLVFPSCIFKFISAQRNLQTPFQYVHFKNKVLEIEKVYIKRMPNFHGLKKMDQTYTYTWKSYTNLKYQEIFKSSCKELGGRDFSKSLASGQELLKWDLQLARTSGRLKKSFCCIGEVRVFTLKEFSEKLTNIKNSY